MGQAKFSRYLSCILLSFQKVGFMASWSVEISLTAICLTILDLCFFLAGGAATASQGAASKALPCYKLLTRLMSVILCATVWGLSVLCLELLDKDLLSPP